MDGGEGKAGERVDSRDGRRATGKVGEQIDGGDGEDSEWRGEGESDATAVRCGESGSSDSDVGWEWIRIGAVF